MTEVSECVKALRELHNAGWFNGRDGKSPLLTAASLLERMEGALKPFAAQGGFIERNGYHHSDYIMRNIKTGAILGHAGVSVTDMLNAMRALSPPPPTKEG